MATKSYKPIETTGTKAEGPVVAYQQTAYTLTDSDISVPLKWDELNN